MLGGSEMDAIVAVVGLGYVGLPLAVAFGKHFQTVGFDLCSEKIAAYQQDVDPTGEVSNEEFLAAKQNMIFTNDVSALSKATYIVVAVPTPVDDAHRPDFQPLIKASESIAPYIKKGAIVIYESTVYPGATEEVCIPVLERCSGKKWQEDFNVGYSPERINPGDRTHRLSNVVKVVSGDNHETLEKVAQLYEQVVTVGVHRVSNIKSAEAAKVIENTQRDINIALINELAILFHRLGVDTREVLEAAGTKWNFLPFKPGLVGGHCIGVDPYYLTHKAEQVGYTPQIILAGRRINDGMGKYIAENVVKQMIGCKIPVVDADVIFLGLTFKENCSDIRNTKAVDVIQELQAYHINVHLFDPHADPVQVKKEYGLALKTWDELPQSNVLVAAVPHREFLEKPLGAYKAKLMTPGLVVDVKSVFALDAFDESSGITYWAL